MTSLTKKVSFKSCTFLEIGNVKFELRIIIIIFVLAERQAAAIRAIRDVEIEHTLTALDLLCSYFTEEQIQTPVLGFFKDNLPDLSIARDEESGEIELKWNDSDGVDVNDSILKRLSMGFPDLYNNSRPSLGGYNNGMIDGWMD